jgi:hypothetical protein
VLPPATENPIEFPATTVANAGEIKTDWAINGTVTVTDWLTVMPAASVIVRT